jgi:microsomal dipeptidase-like Zn-dependent dipeptidase
MLVDLHAHFPMHVMPRSSQRTHEHVKAWTRRRWQWWLVNVASRVVNYQGPRGDDPSVTEELMRQGDVGVALSVLYAPFDEMDLSQPYGAPPLTRYTADVIAELESVEAYVSEHSDAIAIAHSPAELDRLLGGGTPVLVHAIEGGFQLGRDEQEVRANAKALAGRGVAYVTVAHLFWRGVAANAPAIPFLPDRLYNALFPPPKEPLPALGRVALEALVENGILIDITHMSEAAIRETFAVLHPDDPVIATHTAFRFGGLEYPVTEDTIREVARHGGVLGCIFCKHFITNGGPSASTYQESFEALCRHIDKIQSVTGSFDHVAIGSDLDGYIKPALPGLEHMGLMGRLQESLVARYGDENAEKISSGNALRVLRSHWRGGPDG